VALLANDNSRYTTPLTAPEDLRDGSAACPAFRKCGGGRLLPGVQFANCPTATDVQFVGELQNNTDFGLAFLVNTPTNDVAVTQYPLTFRILSVQPVTAGCTWGAGNTSLFSFNTATNKLRVGATALMGDRCTSGFAVSFRAQRTADATLYDDCTTVTVGLITVNQAPVISAASLNAARSVRERSGVGTPVGAPILAVDPDRGQQVIWSITSLGTPFAIDACAGQLTVAAAALDFNTQASYLVTVQARDTGTPPISVSATVSITVLDIPDAPVVGTTALAIRENSPLGTVAGNINAADPDVGTVLVYSVLRADTPDVFTIDGAGNVVVKLAALDYETRPLYVYRVEVCV
jgi:hypothetical protein